MEFEELQDELDDLLNFTSGGTDQDFTANQRKKALNQAYTREVRKAKLEGHRDWFKNVESITWPASTVTLTLPPGLRNSDFIAVSDITDNDPGNQITIGSMPTSSTVFWKDRKTLQWGSDGPPKAMTLRVTYYLSATPLISDSDEPDIIPPEFHEIIYYSAGVELRDRADEGAPASWIRRLEDNRLDLHKFYSRGRLTSQPPLVRFGNGITVDVPAATQDGSSIGN